MTEFLVKWKILDGKKWKRDRDMISAELPFGKDEALDLLDSVVDMDYAEAMEKVPSFCQAQSDALFPTTWEVVSVEAKT